MKFAITNKCPRCNLSQKGIYKCQYCGYDLTKYNKKHTKKIRQRLKDIISGLKKSQIVSSNKRSRVPPMKNAGSAFKRTDNLGRRSGTDRRGYKYTDYTPERRSGMDRRK